MDIREYVEERDLAAIQRIWYEVGWVEKPEEPIIKDFMSAGRCITALINDTPECAVHTVPGRIQYVDQDLELCVVSAVTTSRIARKQGFAQRLTAHQLGNSALEGKEVAALGMFDQGFYDLLGFGSGAYDNQFTFDPKSLLLTREYKIPQRLGEGDWQAMHQAMVNRMRGHGGCVLSPPVVFKAELQWADDGFGLGYYEGSELTHFFWCSVEEGEHGPYEVQYIAYQNTEQLLDLLYLIKSLGDQVSSFTMTEPPEVNLQDLLREPFRTRRNSKGSKHANTQKAYAWWQLRILDLAACVAKVHWQGDPIAFNLALDDPAEKYLVGHEWQGVGGDYRIELGANSSANPGFGNDLPTLKTTVNDFTRILFGAASATNLALVKDTHAPAELLHTLDSVFRLPPLSTSWDF